MREKRKKETRQGKCQSIGTDKYLLSSCDSYGYTGWTYQVRWRCVREEYGFFRAPALSVLYVVLAVRVNICLPDNLCDPDKGGFCHMLAAWPTEEKARTSCTEKQSCWASFGKGHLQLTAQRTFLYGEENVNWVQRSGKSSQASSGKEASQAWSIHLSGGNSSFV